MRKDSLEVGVGVWDWCMRGIEKTTVYDGAKNKWLRHDGLDFCGATG